MAIIMDKEVVYTKTEVDRLIAEAKFEAIEEAREIDRLSMAKHNWTATVQYDPWIDCSIIIC